MIKLDFPSAVLVRDSFLPYSLTLSSDERRIIGKAHARPGTQGAIAGRECVVKIIKKNFGHTVIFMASLKIIHEVEVGNEAN
jgi:hypothetical protein